MLAATIAAQDAPLHRPTGALHKILFLTQSAGFQHPVVKRMQRGVRALAEKQLTDLCAGLFEVYSTQDCAVLEGDIGKFAAIVFYTTGELPLSEQGKRALFDYVENGGGFVGIHSATDTLYKEPDYGTLIGGWFDGHPWHQVVRLRNEVPDHPATLHLGDAFEIRDEIYQFKSWSRKDKTVLLSLTGERADLDKGRRSDRDYGIAWVREHGKGRVFYTALGHRPDVWRDPRFRKHLFGGLRWAANATGALDQRPEGASALLNAGHTTLWRHVNGKPVRWKNVDDAVEVEPGSGSIVTVEPHGAIRLHVEFRLPPRDGKRGQARGTSGVYIQRRYEVQILDSWDEPITNNGCGALYRQRPPDTNATRAPEEWQTYDIAFWPARYENGTKAANARIAVVHNGVLIHDHVELTAKTGAGQPEGDSPAPLLLQDHGARVRYRNLWWTPLPQ